MTERTCGNCSAWEPMPNGGTGGLCRANPPTPMMIGVQQMAARLVTGKPQEVPIIQAFHPPRQATEWCRDGWRPNAARLIADADAEHQRKHGLIAYASGGVLPRPGGDPSDSIPVRLAPAIREDADARLDALHLDEVDKFPEGEG
jgi:hypothetical protein